MQSIIPFILKRKNAKQFNSEFDGYLYKLHHLIENIFAILKCLSTIATNYEKLAHNFKSMCYLAYNIIYYKMNWGNALVIKYNNKTGNAGNAGNDRNSEDLSSGWISDKGYKICLIISPQYQTPILIEPPNKSNY